MALYSNWNVLTLPIKADGKYKIGDTYHVLDEEYPIGSSDVDVIPKGSHEGVPSFAETSNETVRDNS